MTSKRTLITITATVLCNLLSCTESFILLHPAQTPPFNTRTTSSLQSSVSPDQKCPFIGVFPRYKINLTNSKKEKPRLMNQLLPFVGNFMQQLRFERDYGNGAVQVLPELDGVHAFSALWTAVSDLIHDTSRSSNSKMIHLRDCDKRIVINWVEMMDWINDMEGLEIIKVKATLLENDVILLQRQDSTTQQQHQQTLQNSILHDKDTIERRTKAWVKRILVDLGICPFTKSITKSGQGLSDLGVPVGAIAYHTTQSKDVYTLMADTWKAISEMIRAGPSGKDGISSILMMAPEFDQDFDIWSGPIFCLLESGVMAAQAESQVGVVCFHPDYKTPDGSTFPGFGHMHSVPRLERWVTEVKEGECPFSTSDLAAGGAWQRRTPHATINVLRADQLEVAETRRNTPQLYTANIEALVTIGSQKLEQDLNRERQIQ